MFLPWGKSLPSSLQFKLGTKKVCVSFYFVCFISLLFFFVEVLFFFLLFFFSWPERRGCSVSTGPLAPPSHLLYLNIQHRKGALLCFDLLLYSVVNVWRRGVSAHLPGRPSLPPSLSAAAAGGSGLYGAWPPRWPSREPRYCLMG